MVNYHRTMDSCRRRRDLDLIAELYNIKGKFPSIEYDGRSNQAGLVNIALDNCNREVANFIMEKQRLSQLSKDVIEALTRMGATSDYWASKWFKIFDSDYSKEKLHPNDNPLSYSSNQREFLQLFKRMLDLGLIDDEWMLETLEDPIVNDIITIINLVELYGKYFPNYDFDQILNNLYSIKDKREYDNRVLEPTLR